MVYLFDDRARIIYNASGSQVEIHYELLDETESLEKGDVTEGKRCPYVYPHGTVFRSKNTEGVAQLVECQIVALEAVGSKPITLPWAICPKK